MRINASGNVGIGTVSPGAKLAVQHGVSGEYALALFHSDNNSAHGLLIESNGGNSDDNLLMIRSDLNGSTKEAMAVLGSGNVGIGTTAPSAPLQIAATSNIFPRSNGLYVYNETNSGDNQHAIVAMRVAGANAGDPFISWDINGVTGWSMGIDNSDGGKLKIAQSWEKLDTNTLMTIDTSGNVGIGTTTPQYPLDITPDTDNSLRIGKAQVGYVGGHTDFAGFAHIDCAGDAGKYGFLQKTDGTSFINSATDRDIHFRENNVDKMVLGNGALNVLGKILVNGSTPFMFRRFRNLGDDLTYDTGVETGDYAAGIVGMAALGGDIYENSGGNILRCYVFETNYRWHIRADFKTHNAGENWFIDVMFVRKELATVDEVGTGANNTIPWLNF